MKSQLKNIIDEDDYNPRERRFLARWEKQRQHKWRYAVIHGGLVWGIPTGLVFYFWILLDFNLALFDLWKMLSISGLYFIGGIPLGIFNYSIHENRYNHLKNNP